MNAIQSRKRINQAELDACVPPEASWHREFADTAFIYIGGLDLDLSEGDIITIFSQYGEPVWLKLARDKDTGKSRGFAWLKYEDQRSCDLAVDNLSGAKVMERLLNVDHTRYKARDDEDMREFDIPIPIVGRAAEGEEESEDEARPLLREEKELLELLSKEGEEDDPMRQYVIEKKRAEVEKAKKRYKRQQQKEKRDKDRHSHRSEREKNGDSRRGKRDRDEDPDRERSHRSRRERRDYSDEEYKRNTRRQRDRDEELDREMGQNSRKSRRDGSEDGYEQRKRRHTDKSDEDDSQRESRREREEKEDREKKSEREDRRNGEEEKRSRRRERSWSVSSIMTIAPWKD